jgi:hypothetical protein
LSIKHILPLAMGVVLTLAGCGIRVPDIQENPWASQPDVLVQAILASIRCEIKDAVVYVINNDWRNSQEYHQPAGAYWLYRDWGVQVQVTLTTDELGGLSPSGSYMPNIFTLIGGATISSEATRTDIVNYYYTIKELYSGRDSHGNPELYGHVTPCNQSYLDKIVDNPNRPVGSLLIKSDLKLREWLDAAVLSYVTNVMPINIPENAKKSPDAKNGISHDVKFQVITNGNITPMWKLALATINPTAPFASASRTRTHDLLVTFGPNDPSTDSNLATNSAAAGSFLAQQIGIASSNTPLHNNVISNSIISVP